LRPRSTALRGAPGVSVGAGGARRRGDRSAGTAARMSDVSAATATNNWLASKLWVIDSRTNGPDPWAVFHTVKQEVIATAVAAPVGPKRRAAQIRTGNTM